MEAIEIPRVIRYLMCAFDKPISYWMDDDICAHRDTLLWFIISGYFHSQQLFRREVLHARRVDCNHHLQR